MTDSLKKLIKKINDQIIYLNEMKMPIIEILASPTKINDLKKSFVNYKVSSENLGYFSCAIKYSDDGREKKAFFT